MSIGFQSKRIYKDDVQESIPRGISLRELGARLAERQDPMFKWLYRLWQPKEEKPVEQAKPKFKVVMRMNARNGYEYFVKDTRSNSTALPYWCYPSFKEAQDACDIHNRPSPAPEPKEPMALWRVDLTWHSDDQEDADETAMRFVFARSQDAATRLAIADVYEDTGWDADETYAEVISIDLDDCEEFYEGIVGGSEA